MTSVRNRTEFSGTYGVLCWSCAVQMAIVTMRDEDTFYSSGERGKNGKEKRNRGVTVKITFL